MSTDETFDLRQQMCDGVINTVAERFNESPDKMLAEVNANSEDSETFIAMLDAAVRVAERYAQFSVEQERERLTQPLRAEVRSAVVAGVAEARGITHEEAAAEITNPLNRVMFDLVIEKMTAVAKTCLYAAAYSADAEQILGSMTGRMRLRRPAIVEIDHEKNE